jgi:DedD protein
VDPSNLRNLDQLQENDDEARMPRGVTTALVMIGGGCVVFAALALGGRASQPRTAKADPLGDLVTQRSPRAVSSTSTADLSPRDVTFPRLLSDEDKPTTALAAVRPASAMMLSAAAPAPPRPPPPTDRLPVVPLPAQSLLEATPVVTRPRDALTKTATDAALSSPATGDAAPAGHEGGYQLQVSSFRTQSEAQAFSDQLRARGHKAYVAEAHVLGRGTWFRVRIGPFQTQHAAAQYRSGFEAREHVVPFVVPPPLQSSSQTHAE